MKFAWLLALSFIGLGFADWDWADTTALDEYVAFVDPEYRWAEIGTLDVPNCTCDTYIVNFTSQVWHTDEFSSHPEWWHYLIVHIPQEADFTQKNAGIIYIEGGSINDGPPGNDGETTILTCSMAMESGGTGAVLKGIPNQPIVYGDDPEQRERTEDASIAWTWRKFVLNTTDPTVLLQFPMTKAAVRALDTINAIVKEKVPDSDVNNFLVTGGSKRGWISWLTASVDQRVGVVAPIVLSILNMNQNLHGHYESLGGWTYVFQDYYEVNLTMHLDEPETQLMMEHIDPYSYRRRLTLPILVCSATGDEFFMPDDSYNFFDDLPDPKYMLMFENTNHGYILKYIPLYRAMGAYWISYLEDLHRPYLNWTMETRADGGVINLYTDTEPIDVVGYYADTISTDPVRRDFRLTTLEGPQNVLWNITDDVEVLDPFNYRLEMDISEDAPYRGFLISVMFEGPQGNFNFEFTSEVNIIPAGRPFPPCVAEGCYGELV